MSRTPLFSRFLRDMRAALEPAGADPAPSHVGRRPGGRLSRREFLSTAAVGALAASGLSAARPTPLTGDVGIVGAGLAGLSAAHELKKNGIAAALYEGAGRAGGRCWSLGGAFAGPVTFPGQVVERGGELIDNLHKTMIGYAREFGLTLENMHKPKAETAYYFQGRHVSEAEIVSEYRALVAAMRPDLRRISKAPDATSHTEADIELDNLSLAEYLDSRGAGPLAREAIRQAYIAEYGLEIEHQSCLNFLFFIHADRRSRFQPFGVFSDERYHVVEGNQSIPAGLASRLAGQIEYGLALSRVSRTPAGRVELVFNDGAQVRTHDAVILTIPFSTLRLVDLDASLDLPDWKRHAIDHLGYGTNAKMMVGFTGQPWEALGSRGSSYSDLAHHQATWQTNPIAATASRAVLTDYSGGTRGANLDPAQVQNEVSLFLADLDLVFPGAAAQAASSNGAFLVHLEHWPSNPWTRGSYTCYLPGQFTTIAGNEGKAVGNLFFAGEHANSFYEWQGFMEGAALSGIDAAAAILRPGKS